VWDHWLCWSIPLDTESIPGGTTLREAVEGQNDYGEIGWGRPDPPNREHTYRFLLYAPETDPDLGPDAAKDDRYDAASGHTIGTAELTGTDELEEVEHRRDGADDEQVGETGADAHENRDDTDAAQCDGASALVVSHVVPDDGGGGAAEIQREGGKERALVLVATAKDEYRQRARDDGAEREEGSLGIDSSDA